MGNSGGNSGGSNFVFIPELLCRGLHSHVSENDMIHATVHDHVLECALFQQKMLDSRVAILTDDISLTIKARAEVILSCIFLDSDANRLVQLQAHVTYASAFRRTIKTRV